MLLRKLLVLWALVTAAMAQQLGQPVSTWGYSTQNTADAAWTSATSNNTRVTQLNNQTIYNAILVTLVQGTTISGGQVTFQQSNDNSNWIGVQCVQLGTTTIVGPTYTLVASTNVMFLCPVSAPYFGTLLSPAITGTGTVTVGHNALTLPSVALTAGTETLAAGTNIIGALVANQSVNVAQVGGSNTSTAATGVQKVGVVGGTGTALDGSTAGVVDENMKLINNSTVSTAATGVQKVGIVGSAGATVDQAPGSAVPTNAVQVGETDGTNTRVRLLDPCVYATLTRFYINNSSNVQIAGAAGSSKNYYICQLTILPVAGAANVNLVSSSTAGNACATATTALLTAGTTAATGATLTANGGFVLPATGTSWATTQATNHAFCLFTSAAVTGVLIYAGPL